MSDGLRLELPVPPELVEAVAQRAAQILEDRQEDSRSPWLTVDQAAEHTGVPKQSLYKLTSAKAVPHRKVGARVLFSRQELDEWLDDHAEGPVRPRLRAVQGRR